MYLYAARDVNTGKLVTNITNPGRKFWEKMGSCQKAIDSYYGGSYYGGSYYKRRNSNYNLELVTFELIEVDKKQNKNDSNEF